MNTFRVTSGAWVAAMCLALTGASCATPKSAALLKEPVLRRHQPLERATSTELEAAAKADIQVAYAQLPLSFESNHGQTDAQVQFLSRGHGYTLFLTSTEAVLALRKPQEHALALTPTEGVLEQEPRTQPVEHTVLRMQLVGANPNPRVEAVEELPGTVNYLIGNDPTTWKTNIPTYAKVHYQDVYPGVDLLYYGTQRHLEYDFIVAPGVDPAIITLAFERTDHVRLDAQGQLILAAGGEEVRLLKPRIYQEIDGVKHPIPGSYVLRRLEPQTIDVLHNCPR